MKRPLSPQVAVIGLLCFLAIYSILSYASHMNRLHSETVTYNTNGRKPTQNLSRFPATHQYLYDSEVPGLYKVVTLRTKFGKIEFGMLEKHAPVTAKRFIKLAEDKVWVGGSYYRSEPSFVLQGGLWGKKEYELPSLDLEYKVPNLRGMVSMARAADPDSATTEWAIQVADNDKWLGPGGADEYGYAVFAVVVDGWRTIEKIMSQPSKNNNGITMLLEPVEILDCWVEERESPK